MSSKRHFESFNLWAVLAQVLDYANADASEANYNWGRALANFGHLHEALNLMNKVVTCGVGGLQAGSAQCQLGTQASMATVMDAAEAAAKLRNGMAAECTRHPDYSDENPYVRS
eukprot:COSAG02_NODE_220_length_28426_cov_28.546863_9_plen_114_part_00